MRACLNPLDTSVTLDDSPHSKHSNGVSEVNMRTKDHKGSTGEDSVKKGRTEKESVSC